MKPMYEGNTPLETQPRTPQASAEERWRVLQVWSKSEVRPDLARPELLHRIFEEQAERAPNNIALLCQQQTLTYRELDTRADHLACALRARGLGPGTFVALWLPRSFDVYVAMLGVLKAGAAYVPIDPDYPIERVNYIVSDCRAGALVTVSSLAESLPTPPCSLIRLDQTRDDGAASALPHASARPATPDDLCYVIYTSGSTGQPKGVAIEHRSAAHLVRAEQAIFGTRAEDRVFQGFSAAFDAAVEEIWLAFASGATLVVGEKSMLLSGLAEHLTTLRVTVFSTVPTLLATIEADLPTVRLLIVGGEACPQALVQRWSTKTRQMWNTYGPTETTVIATCTRLHADQPVTIGRAIPNYFTYVLGPAGELVPAGAAGELCIGGIGLARGYVGRPELSAQRFIANPFASEPGAPPRLYKTGDRVRYDAAGNLMFLGRLDEQVKVRGFRVELGEIEAALLRCRGVRHAAVILRQDGEAEAQLVGYVVPQAGSELSVRGLHAELRKSLPAYMVPTHTEVLASLPTLPSGKIDRSRLPAPQRSQALPPVASGLPGDPLAEKIGRAWALLFGVASVSPDDDFFVDLGGHSLLAATMISALRRDPELRTLSVLDVYECPSVAKLAARHRARASLLPATPADAAHQTGAAARTTPPRARYYTCAGAQLFGLYVIFGLYSAQWLAPYLAYVWMRHFEASIPRALLVTAAALFAVYPFTLLLAVVVKWLVIGRYKAGRYPLWGLYYFRFWLVDRVLAMAPTGFLAGTPLLNAYYRLLGARIGRNVFLGSDNMGAIDLVSIGDDCSVGLDSDLSGYTVEDGMLVIGRIDIGQRCDIGTRSVLTHDVTMLDDSSLGDLSMLPRGTTVPGGEAWAGSPAQVHGEPVQDTERSRPSWLTRTLFTCAYTFFVLALPGFFVSAVVPGLVFLNYLHRHTNGAYHYLLAAPLVAVVFILILCADIVMAKWLILGKLRPGRHAIWSTTYLRFWLFDKAMGVSLDVLGGLYATLFLNPWYRLLGVRLGKLAEVSTASTFVPDLLDIEDAAFVADCVSLGTPRIAAGYIHMEETRIGKRAFIGNSAVVPAGSVVGDDALLGCLSVAPTTQGQMVPPGETWFGSPPIKLSRRQESSVFPLSTTYRPGRALFAQRLAIEFLRVTLPTTCFVILTCLIMTSSVSIYERVSLGEFVALFPLLYVSFGLAAACFVVALKWLVVGRYQPGEKPLWNHFVWRSELITAMHENLVNAFLTVQLEGTPYAAWFFRALGAKIGRRVYMGTTEFTEYDLVSIGDDVCLNNDCTLQTHLFEDRVMKMSTVRIDAGCTVGGDAVVLYDTHMEPGSKLGSLSLLMKGETLSAGSSWEGSPARAARRPGTQP